MSCLFVLTLLAGLMYSPVRVRVEDVGGAPLRNELVIVQDLGDHEHELSRALSDQNGDVPELDLKPGLYRAIATMPYGLWETEVQEFVVRSQRTSQEVMLRLRSAPTHGNGDIVVVEKTPSLDVQVLQSNGSPASGAEVLARDPEATLYLERWYTADGNGVVKVDLLSEPLVLVAIYNNRLQTAKVTRKDARTVIRFPKDSRPK